MNKKYQVFISSTYSDLKEERAEVTKTILELDCIPSGMEAFCSESEEQFEIIKRIIDLCDYYVLIIANRYGSINKKENKSYTELEYEYACMNGIPVLAFIADESANKPSDNKIERLDNFKRLVSENRMISYWKNKDELARKVAVALSNAFKKDDRIGWVKTSENAEELLKLKACEEENTTLKKQIEKDEEDIAKLKKEIEDLSFSDTTLLYDQKPICIRYYASGNITTKTMTIKSIFENISIHFLNISKREDGFMELIARAIDNNNYQRISEVTLKKIANQLLALNLFTTHWSKDNKALYYELTRKGKLERDKLNLFTI